MVDQGTSTMGRIIRVIHLKRRLDMTLASYRWTGLRTLLEISVIKQMEVKLMLLFFSFCPFVLGGLDWTVEAGATPWENDFYTGGENSSYSKDMINGFAVCEVGIEALKEIKISESWSLPLFAKAIWNPSTEGLYFVAGLSF